MEHMYNIYKSHRNIEKPATILEIRLELPSQRNQQSIKGDNKK